jgi:P27 family predicted phage terminase small subunit
LPVAIGRPPKPAEQKRKLGNPGKRDLPELASVAALPALPADALPDSLGDDGAALWEAVTASAKTWLAPTDHPVLRMLCELADRRAEFVAHVAKNGPLIERPDGHLVANPVVAMLSDVEKRMVHMASLLGMTPSDRTRIGLGEVKAQNAFEQMLANRRTGGPQ